MKLEFVLEIMNTDKLLNCVVIIL